MKHFKALSLSLLACSVLLSACGGDKIQTEAKYPTGYDRTGSNGNIYEKPKSVFGEDGLSFFGGKNKNDNGDGANGIDVNSFLWRASLDTVSFMPLASADPFGGVILTDWYTPANAQGERYKLNVFILGRQLRSDGIEVRVFKQIGKKGAWVDAPPSPEMARQLENTILTRARQLRVAQAGGE